MNLILKERDLEIADYLEINTDNIEDLPDSVVEMLVERRKWKLYE